MINHNASHYRYMKVKRLLYNVLYMAAAVAAMSGCAKMGQPDGGWYDETPPRIIGTSPKDKATHVNTNKMYIHFDEFIKLDNPTEKVVVSPPQMEMAEIKGASKNISIELKDSLKKDVTYTIDFSDAISDNNEDNPLGNFTYSFSTGAEIDTMEVAGYVVESQNLEPIKGILVGLYDNLTDTVFRHQPFLRVSRTDSRGHFSIKGVKPGNYRVYALQDMDGNYFFSQKSEKIAFNHDIVVPSSRPDVRQDTIWRDSLRIDSIIQIPYTHYLPDDIVLKAFTESQTDRFFVKSERKNANRFSVYFSYGDAVPPTIRGLDFNAENAFVVEANEKNDTITYWLKDSTLIDRDTLHIEMTYNYTDSSGVLVPRTDSLELLSKEPYEKRMKQKEKQYGEWKKKQEKAKKKGDPFEKEMPAAALEPKYEVASALDPDKNQFVLFDTPLAGIDSSKIHLYSKYDTLWYEVPFVFRKKAKSHRTYELLGEWKPQIEYSLEIDSAAFTDIYGKVSKPQKMGFKVRSNDEYASVFFTLTGMQNEPVVAQLLNSSDKVVKEVKAEKGFAEFFYVYPGTYYLRIFIDRNGNGVWDTGSYDEDRQAENVYYYPEKIECKEMWDVTRSWNPLAVNVARQKPGSIVQQKADKAKTIRRRNWERAKKLGIDYIQKRISDIQ